MPKVIPLAESDKLKSSAIAVMIFLATLGTAFAFFAFYYYSGDGIAQRIHEMRGKERGAYAPPVFSAVEEKSYTAEFLSSLEKAERGAAVVFDVAHKNSYSMDEVIALLKELGAKGVSFEFLAAKGELSGSMRYATALVIISPAEDYEKSEIEEIKKFAAKGGKVVLIADPTRKGSISAINSISSQLGITFEQDYLYNLKENAGNFRYIIIKNFERNEITSGLSSLVFYVSCSISSEYGAAFGDENTISSSRLEKKLSPASFIPDSALAICDQSFMQEYYSSAQDNAKLVSNIADFLAKPKRAFFLEDFPYIFVEKKVKISYINDSLLEKVLKLKNILKRYGIEAELEKKLDEEKNSIFLGVYADLENATPHVELSIFEKEKIKLNSIELSKNLTSIIYAEDTRLWILGSAEDEINELLDLIEKGEIDKHLLTKSTAAIIHKPKIEKIEKKEELPEAVSKEKNETSQ